MTLTNSTAVALNSTCSKGRAILFSVETNNVRMRMDGSSPTLNTGVLFNSGDSYLLEGINCANVKFQRTTGTAKVSVQALKNANDRDR